MWLKEKIKTWWFWIFPIAAVAVASTLFIGEVKEVKLVQDVRVRFEKGYKIPKVVNGVDSGIAVLYTDPVHYQKNGQWTAIQDGFKDNGTSFGFIDSPITGTFPKQFGVQTLSKDIDSVSLTPVNFQPSQGELIDKGYTDIDGNSQPTILYKEAYAGVDAEVHGAWNGSEMFYTVKSATSAPIIFNTDSIVSLGKVFAKDAD